MLRTIGVMQPYLFPYLGYFQLIATSDAFVLCDDLQYVKGSWINRNRVLCDGQPKLISFPLKKAGHLATIRERWLCDDFHREAAALLRRLAHLYQRAPHREEVMPLIKRILEHPERNLAAFNEQSIRALCEHLGIDTPICRASDLGLAPELEMQERVIQTVEKLHGKLYINPIGGMDLYCPAAFRARGLQLRFLQMNEFRYPQFKEPFVPGLSIIDVLMFNSRDEVRDMLERFSLLNGKEPHREAEPA
jgi:hypothetical protein